MRCSAESAIAILQGVLSTSCRARQPALALGTATAPVTRQPVLPILITARQGCSMAGPETGAVNEQLTLHPSFTGELQRCTNPLAGPTQPLRPCPRFVALEVFRILAQIRCVQRRIEVISVVESRARDGRVRLRPAETARSRGYALTQKLSICGKGRRCRSADTAGEVDSGNVAAVAAERMKIPLPRLPPVDKFDAEFVGSAGRPQEISLIDSNRALKVRIGGMSPRRLRSCRSLRIHQADPGVAVREKSAESGRGHPARGARRHDDASMRLEFTEGSPSVVAIPY